MKVKGNLRCTYNTTDLEDNSVDLTVNVEGHPPLKGRSKMEAVDMDQDINEQIRSLESEINGLIGQFDEGGEVDDNFVMDEEDLTDFDIGLGENDEKLEANVFDPLKLSSTGYLRTGSSKDDVEGLDTNTKDSEIIRDVKQSPGINTNFFSVNGDFKTTLEDPVSKVQKEPTTSTDFFSIDEEINDISTQEKNNLHAHQPLKMEADFYSIDSEIKPQQSLKMETDFFSIDNEMNDIGTDDHGAYEDTGTRFSDEYFDDREIKHEMQNEEGWVMDETVPDGWQIKRLKSSNKNLIMDPYGKVFHHRRAALNYMRENGYSPFDMAEMRLKLRFEGWEINQFLPQGWKYKICSDNKVEFLTAGDQILSPSTAYKYILGNYEYSDDGIKQFKMAMQLIDKVKLLNSKDWALDETLPNGWKSRCSRMNGKKIFFLSPEGNQFPTRFKALQFMVESGWSAPEDILKMMSTLTEENWKSHNLLPVGWMFKEGFDKIQFINEEGRYFSSGTVAVDSMMANPKYLEQEIKNVMLFNTQGVARKNAEKYDWMDDSSLPGGWKMRMLDGPIKEEENLMRFALLSPDGFQFKSRTAALEFMVQSKYGWKDLEMMKDGLIYEEWMDSDLLPPGWKYKVLQKSSKRQIKFLTSNFIFISSTTEAQEHIVTDPQYNDEDRNKILMFSNLESRLKEDEANKKRIALYTWNDNDDTIPKGWKSRSDGKKKYFLSPDGKEFSSRREAIKLMTASQCDKSQVDEMRILLVYEGWKDDPNLPQGWKMKRKDNKKLVLSKEGELFFSFKQGWTFIENNKGRFSDVEIDKYRKNFVRSYNASTQEVKDDNWISDDEKVPKGWMMRFDGVTTSVKSPAGLVFRTRRMALIHLVKTGASEDDVSNMRKSMSFDGWKEDKNLPLLWMWKKKSHNLVFCSENGTLFDSKPKVIDYMEMSDAFTQEDKNKFSSFGNSNNNASNFHQTPGCENKKQSVPKGWSSSVNSLGRKCLISPSGSQFQNMRLAFKHLIETSAPEEEVLEMKECLKQEGWKTDKMLPESWFWRRFRQSITFLTGNGTLLEGKTTACMYMKNSNDYNEEDLQKLNSFQSEQSLADPEKLTSFQSNQPPFIQDKTVPKGWRSKVFTNHGKTFRYVISPTNTEYRSKRAALHDLVRKGAAETLQDEMRKSMEHDGWKTDPSLPAKWLWRNNNYHIHFISPDGLLILSKTKAVDYMKSKGKYSKEELQKMGNFSFRGGQNGEKTATMKPGNINTELFSSDPSLPVGWKSRKVCFGGSMQRILISPTSEEFKSARVALRHLVKSGAKVESVEAMRRTLSSDGWLKAPYLPKEWRIKKRGEERVLYLTETGDLLASHVDALNYLKGNAKFTSEQVDSFRLATEKKSLLPPIPIRNPFHSQPTPLKTEDRVTNNRIVPDSWKNDGTVPQGWKTKGDILKSPSGQQFPSRISAYKSMIRNKQPPKDITEFRKSLTNEGWKSYEHLPAGWIFKRTKSNFFYMSDTGEEFRSHLAALQFVNSNPKYKHCIEELRKFAEKTSQIIRANGNTEIQDRTVPLGWKTKEEMKNGKLWKYILSPKGTPFLSRRQALCDLIKRKLPAEEMRSCLVYEGWKQFSLLPSNWRFRRSRDGGNFLSSVGEVLKTEDVLSSTEIKNEKSIITGKEIDNLKIFVEKVKLGGSEFERFLSHTSVLQVNPRKNKEKEDNITVLKVVEATNIKEPKTRAINEARINPQILKNLCPETKMTRVVIGQATRSENVVTQSYGLGRKVIAEKSAAEALVDELVDGLLNDVLSRGKGNKFLEMLVNKELATYPSRLNQLKHMVEKGSSIEKITVVLNLLRKEGWHEARYLPKNWLTMKQKGKAVNINVISTEGHLFKSYKSAIQYMMSSDKYDDNDVDHFKLFPDGNINRKIEVSKPTEYRSGIYEKPKQILSRFRQAAGDQVSGLKKHDNCDIPVDLMKMEGLNITIAKVSSPQDSISSKTSNKTSTSQILDVQPNEVEVVCEKPNIRKQDTYQKTVDELTAATVMRGSLVKEKSAKDEEKEATKGGNIKVSLTGDKKSGKESPEIKNDITNSIILDVLEDIKSLLEPSNNPGAHTEIKDTDGKETTKEKNEDVPKPDQKKRKSDDVDLNLRRSKRLSASIASEKIKNDISNENEIPLPKSSTNTIAQVPLITEFKSEFEKFVSAKESEDSETSTSPMFHESISVTRVSDETKNSTTVKEKNETPSIPITPLLDVENGKTPGDILADPVFQSNISVTRLSKTGDKDKEEIVCMPDIIDLPGAPEVSSAAVTNLPSSVSVKKITEEKQGNENDSKEKADLERLNLLSTLSVKRLNDSDVINQKENKSPRIAPQVPGRQRTKRNARINSIQKNIPRLNQTVVKHPDLRGVKLKTPPGPGQKVSGATGLKTPEQRKVETNNPAVPTKSQHLPVTPLSTYRSSGVLNRTRPTPGPAGKAIARGRFRPKPFNLGTPVTNRAKPASLRTNVIKQSTQEIKATPSVEKIKEILPEGLVITVTTSSTAPPGPSQTPIRTSQKLNASNPQIPKPNGTSKTSVVEPTVPGASKRTLPPTGRSANKVARKTPIQTGNKHKVPFPVDGRRKYPVGVRPTIPAGGKPTTTNVGKPNIPARGNPSKPVAKKSTSPQSHESKETKIVNSLDPGKPTTTQNSEVPTNATPTAIKTVPGPTTQLSSNISNLSISKVGNENSAEEPSLDERIRTRFEQVQKVMGISGLSVSLSK